MMTFAKSVLGFAGSLLLVSTGLAQSYSIDTFTIAGGSGTVGGGGYSMSGTVGQPDGNLALDGGDFSLAGGFWNIAAASSGSVTIFDNSGGDANGYESATTNAWLANKLCTGGQAYQLDSVTLLLVSGDSNGNPRVRSVQLQLYTNDPVGGRPSANTGLIMNLSGATNPIAMANSYIETPIKWVPARPFTLTANTCYWVVLSTDIGEVGGIASFTTPAGDAGALGRTASADAGATWQAADSGSNRKMTIRGTPVSVLPPPPQPRITAVEKVGNDLRLSFTSAAGGKYAVQACADLVVGNWASLPDQSASGTGDALQLTLPSAFDQAQQFYRIVIVP